MELELYKVEVDANYLGNGINKEILVSGEAKVIYFVHQADIDKSADVELTIEFGSNAKVSGYTIDSIIFNEEEGNTEEVRQFIKDNLTYSTLNEVVLTGLKS